MVGTAWLLPHERSGRSLWQRKDRRSPKAMATKSTESPNNWPSDPTQVRHVLSLSGGKDSAALAVHLRDRITKMEYIFHDTGKELPDTYAYLDRLEGYLGQKIVRTTFGT